MVRTISNWYTPKITGYKPCTEYWRLFTAAESQKETEIDACKAIKKTLEAILPGAKGSVKNFTELVLVLNHKCWDHFYLRQHQIGQLYSDLYKTYWDWGLNHFKGDDAYYLIATLD